MAQMAKAWGGTFEDPVYREENLAVTGKKLIFGNTTQQSPFNLESKLWKLAFLIDCFDQKTQSHLDLSDITGSNPTGLQKTRTTIQKYNNYSVMKKKEENWFSELWYCHIFRVLEVQRLLERVLFCVVCHLSAWKKFTSHFELLFIQWYLSWNLRVIMLKWKKHFMNNISALRYCLTFLMILG